MKFMGKQRGMGLTASILLVLIIFFFIYLGIKLVPPFIHNYMVKSSLQKTTNEVMLDVKIPYVLFKANVSKKFNGYLNINSIDSVSSKDLKFKNHKTYYQVQLKYTQIVPMTKRMSVHINFEDNIKIKTEL